jgi:hypothetical protein
MPIESAFQLAVEVIREPDGELLAQEPWSDTGHLADELRYHAASRGLVPDEPGRLRTRLEPVFTRPGEPSLSGLRLTLHASAAAEPAAGLEFSSQVAGSRGTELTRDLIGREVLREGDRYRVRLVAVPRPDPGATATADHHPERDAFEEDPFPVRRVELSNLGVTPEAIAGADRRRPVFIAQAVVDRAVSEAIRHGSQETGTLLLGVLAEDPALRAAGFETSWALVITESMAVEDGEGTPASFTFPPEALRRARQLAGLRGREEVVAGSQHSHGWRCLECGERRCQIRNIFFSSDDDRMARLFPIFAAFLVTGGDPERDPDRPVVSLFARLGGVMEAIPFGAFP